MPVFTGTGATLSEAEANARQAAHAYEAGVAVGGTVHAAVDANNSCVLTMRAKISAAEDHTKAYDFTKKSAMAASCCGVGVGLASLALQSPNPTVCCVGCVGGCGGICGAQVLSTATRDAALKTKERMLAKSNSIDLQLFTEPIGSPAYLHKFGMKYACAFATLTGLGLFLIILCMVASVMVVWTTGLDGMQTTGLAWVGYSVLIVAFNGTVFGFVCMQWRP